jgi:hypothetical protein
MKGKVQDLAEAKGVGLRVNIEKTKEIRVNVVNKKRQCVYNEQREEVEHFCYLGIQVTKNGGTGEDIDSRIKMAEGAFAQLTAIWRSNMLSCKTKLRIFSTNVKSLLLYGCQTWKITRNVVNKLQSFINRCL